MDLMSTKEQLRNAVSRAPLVPVFPLSQLLLGQGQAAASSVGGARGDVGVASVNVGVGAGVGAAVASLQLQGPDPRPPNFVEPAVVVEQNGYNISSSSGIGDVETSVAVPAPPSPPPISSAPQGTSAAAVVQAAAGVSTGATTRVSITFEDDEEEGEQEVRELEMGEEAERRVSLQDTTSTPAPSKAAVSTPNKVSTAVAAAAASVTAVPVAVLPAPVAKTPGSCSKKNAKHHSTETNKNPTEVAVQIQSCYDLERELRIAAGDMNMLKTLFKAFKTSQLKSVLKNLSEPTVLHMLLMAVYRYFCSAKKQQFDKVCKWYAAVGAVPRFVMQYALLSEEYKVELRGVLATMASAITAAEDRNSSNDEVLQKIQDLQDIF